MTLNLQTLSDRLEILELGSRYAWVLDKRDWDRMHTVFTEDASADFAIGRQVKGVEEIIGAARSQMDSLEHTQHFCGNHEIEIDGDRATGRLQLIGGAYLTTSAGAPSAAVRGEYVDEYVRTDVGWRISRRQLNVTWGEGNVGILSQQHS